jgi:pilus assembly protein Flp/PilA
VIDMNINRLPLPGVLVSLALFALAASYCPGGYDWANDFVSTLFAPSTATGVANEARFFAVAAMFVFCVSVAVLFQVLSRRACRRVVVLEGSAFQVSFPGSALVARKRSSMLSRLTPFVANFLKSEDGPTAVEYAVMLALIIVVCIGTITTLGSNANTTFNSVAGAANPSSS